MQDTFALLALSIVAEIPAGMVASYGQIALLAGFPKRARMVGAVMSRASQYGDYPCHRVVHSDGSLVLGWQQQRELLEAEGVIFTKQGKVDMHRCRW